MPNFAAFVSLLMLSSISSAFSQEWTYDEAKPIGPSKWWQVNPLCSSSKQSPVNLGWLGATIVSAPKKLTIENIDKLPNAIEYTNDGHGISVGFKFNDGIGPQISGGPLASTYIFYGLHWHWGSEHRIDNREFDAELHMIYFNSKFGSFEVAHREADGLAVLALMYFTGQGLTQSAIAVNTTTETRPFIGLIEKVLKPHKTHIETQVLYSLFEILGVRTFSYLNYQGSLTTPDCYESVNWMVLKAAAPMFASELRLLRKTKNENGQHITKNNRPIQPLNGRVVYSY